MNIQISLGNGLLLAEQLTLPILEESSGTLASTKLLATKQKKIAHFLFLVFLLPPFVGCLAL